MPYVAHLIPDLLSGEMLEYPERITRARELGADLIFCQHLNSLSDPTPNYAMAITPRDAAPGSDAWGMVYAQHVNDALARADVPVTGGPRVWSKRGEANQIRGAGVPAILAEPLFVSRAEAGLFVLSVEGREELADCAVASIQAQLPEGGTVALLCGHLGQPSRPDDHGAPICSLEVKGGKILRYRISWEGDLALDILLRIQRKLQALA